MSELKAKPDCLMLNPVKTLYSLGADVSEMWRSVPLLTGRMSVLILPYTTVSRHIRFRLRDLPSLRPLMLTLG